MNTMLKVYLNVLNILTNEEEGQGMAEYGLIIALAAVLIIAAMPFLSTAVQDLFKSLGEKMVITS